MNFFYKNNGYVSIFLVIIMVPIIAISAVFVDISRVRMAKGLVDSSADLALNSMLTQYDTELSDYYGMMASCQSMEEFYEVAERYFAFCMVSQGVSITDAQQWAEKLNLTMQSSSSINDLMQISVVKDETAQEGERMITPIDGGNLSNPAMMKEQIVEFMKYRAPIELLGELRGNSGFVNKLESVQEQIENLPAETLVQKDKFEYYEAENALLIKALESFTLMKTYESFKPDKVNYVDNAYMEKVRLDIKSGAKDTAPEDQKGLEEKFKTLHGMYVTYWANTEGAKKFTSVDAYATANGGRTLSGKQGKSGLRNAINNCKSARSNYESMKQKMQEVINQIDGAKPSEDRKINEVQYWMYMVKKMKEKAGYDIYNEYVKSLAAFRRAMLNLDYAMNNKEPGYKPTINYIPDPITKILIPVPGVEPYDIGTDDYGDGRSYNKACSDEYSAADSVWKARTSEDIYNISKNLETYSNNAFNSGNLTNGDTKIAAALEEIKKDYANLVTAQTSLELLNESLDGVVDLVAKYKEAHDKWEKDVNENSDKNSKVIERDSEELAIMDGDIPIDDAEREERGLTTVDIDPDKVREYQTRLSNTIELIKSYRAAIESVRYRGQIIVGKKTNDVTEYGGDGIFDLSTLCAAATKQENGCVAPIVDKDKIPFYQDELDTYINQTFEITDELDSMMEITEENSPKLHDYDDLNNLAGIKDFDKWLHDKFEGMEVAEEVAKGLLEKLKSIMDGLTPENLANYKAYVNVTLSDKAIEGWGDLPSQGAVDTADSIEEGKNDKNETDVGTKLDAGNEAGQLFGQINFEKLLEDERDNLYTTEYIMRMFTCETSALEGMYAMGRERLTEEQRNKNIYQVKTKNGTELELAPGNADKLYSLDWDKTKHTWGEKRLSYVHNKSMTNKMQDWDNNYLYGREVEYILYGGDTDSSRTAMAATLLFTRVALNVGPVLDMYWNNDNVKFIANGISGATSGIVPAAAVKLVICMGVCVAESAVDMNYLKAGLPVLFYKSKPKQQLFIQLTIDADTFLNNMKANTTYTGSTIGKNDSYIGEADGVFFRYSDYIRIFLFIGMHASSENIYKRTADIIQLNMQHNVNLTGYEDFRMSQALTGYRIRYKVRVEPLLIKIPFAKQYGSEELLQVDEWNTFTGEVMREY